MESTTLFKNLRELFDDITRFQRTVNHSHHKNSIHATIVSAGVLNQDGTRSSTKRYQIGQHGITSSTRVNFLSYRDTAFFKDRSYVQSIEFTVNDKPLKILLNEKAVVFKFPPLTLAERRIAFVHCKEIVRELLNPTQKRFRV